MEAVTFHDPTTNQVLTVFLDHISAAKCMEDPNFATKIFNRHMQNEEINSQQPNTQGLNSPTPTHFTPVIPNTQESEFWTHNETLALITAYNNHKEDFLNFKKKKLVWTNIAQELESLNIFKPPEKCETKWKNLIRVYKTHKDNAEKTGRGHGKFKYFEEIDEILGDKPSNSSQYTFDTLAVDEPMEESNNPQKNRDHKSDEPTNIDVPTSSNNTDIKLLTKTSGVKKGKNNLRQKRHEERMEMQRKKFKLEERKVEKEKQRK